MTHRVHSSAARAQHNIGNGYVRRSGPQYAAATRPEPCHGTQMTVPARWTRAVANPRTAMQQPRGLCCRCWRPRVPAGCATRRKRRAPGCCRTSAAPRARRQCRGAMRPVPVSLIRARGRGCTVLEIQHSTFGGATVLIARCIQVTGQTMAGAAAGHEAERRVPLCGDALLRQEAGGVSRGLPAARYRVPRGSRHVRAVRRALTLPAPSVSTQGFTS